MKKTGDDAFANRNWTTILAYATLAAGGAVVPVPFVDMAAFTVTNALMFQALARRYGVTWDKEMFGKFCVAIGAGVLAARALRFAAVELIKLVPIVGSAAAAAINGATAFGTTVGLGQAACVWLDHERRGETAPDDAVRAAFAEGLAQRPPGPDPKEQK